MGYLRLLRRRDAMTYTESERDALLSIFSAFAGVSAEIDGTHIKGDTALAVACLNRRSTPSYRNLRRTIGFPQSKPMSRCNARAIFLLSLGQQQAFRFLGPVVSELPRVR